MKKHLHYLWLGLSVVSAFMTVYAAVLAFNSTGWDRVFWAVMVLVWAWDTYMTYDIFRMSKVTARIRAQIEAELSKWGDDYFAAKNSDKAGF